MTESYVQLPADSVGKRQRTVYNTISGAEVHQEVVTLADSDGSLATSRFARALKFEPGIGEEIRRDETTSDDYHGLAVDGTDTSATSWFVVRFYKTDGKIVRVRYREDVAWDSRTAGW